MTLPAVIRIFFAIDLPALTKEKIGSFIVALKKKSKSNAIRWSRPENLHITLQFLAEVRSEHVSLLTDKVRAELAGWSKHPVLTLGALQLFPNPYRPRVIVLDIAPQDELVELSKTVGKGIQSAQYEIENRPFRAHLTLGRIKYPQNIDLSFISEFPPQRAEQIVVNEVVLFRSEPQPEGSVYTILEKINLAVPGHLITRTQQI